MGPKRKTGLHQNIKTPKKIKENFRDTNSIENLKMKDDSENDGHSKKAFRRGRNNWRSSTEENEPANCIPDQLDGNSRKRRGRKSQDGNGDNLEKLQKTEHNDKKNCPSTRNANIKHFKLTENLPNSYSKRISGKSSLKLESDIAETECLSDSESELFTKPVSEMNSSDEEGSKESSSSAWEDVEEIEEKEPIIPKEGVEITLDAPDALLRKRHKKKEFDVEGYFRRKLNRFKKEVQVNLHKVHLLCLLAHGIYLNNLLNDESFHSIALSVIPEEFLGKKSKNIDKSFLKRFTNWFCGSFKITDGESIVKKEGWEPMFKDAFETMSVTQNEEAVAIYILLVRSLGLDSRVIISFQPLPLKAADLIKPKSKKEKTESSSKNSSLSSGSVEKNTDSETNSLADVCQAGPSWRNDYIPVEEKDTVDTSVNSSRKKSDFKNQPLSKTPRRTLRKRTQIVNLTSNTDSEEEEEKDEKKKKVAQKNATISNKAGSNSDSDFEVQVIKMKTPPTIGKLRKNRRAISPDSEEEVQIVSMKRTKKGLNYWTEIYLESEKKWICINCIHEKIDCYMEMEQVVTKPISYILAFDSQARIKDVTHRYAENWMSYTRRLRIDADWWEEALSPFHGKITARDKQEDEDLDNQLLNRPLPMTIAEYKSHPLYVLQRHLLKFEAIYPDDAIPVGFVRGEPVYARECVHTLHSRETWLKEAKVVKPGEKPYKIVKARPKWNKLKGEVEPCQPLEIFGEWQTQDYEPPTATDGKVPRNEYGNVELFKPTMLPKGTVQLRVAGLNRVAKKLGIDCAPAMIGWDFHSGGSHPMYDGWVVCSEFEDTLMDAWRQQEEINKKREKEKYEKRVYGNWKRLIRGLLIRERLKARYGSNEDENL